ncbi:MULTISPECIES: hypothetical protein [unclassified Pseudomonas]|uniref:hypothetical protein n=1 Tax=unclassified Pseudomonas TaxID=196821 RepID=UPI0021148DE7|nr:MULTISPECIES: hypothetical protein [unclassified Pseudomonas]
MPVAELASHRLAMAMAAFSCAVRVGLLLEKYLSARSSAARARVGIVSEAPNSTAKSCFFMVN